MKEVVAGYRESGVQAVVLPYLHDMAGAYAAADLVISRSGATTVAELAVCGKRAVLVPFPFAADNHQEHNAMSLAARGNAEVIIQKNLTGAKLAERIMKHTGPGGAIVSPLENTAAKEIAEICRDYVQKN